MASPCGWSPFDGITCTGRPAATILRGQIAMREAEILGPPSGRPAVFYA
jgi:dihydroorotase